MNQWFQNLLYKFAAFMQGRYGMDYMSKSLITAGFACWLISFFFGIPVLGTASTLIYIYAFYRCFSKNYNKRYAELQKFLALTRKARTDANVVKGNITDKDHSYKKCERCGKALRVPKGKGTIMITCPHCGHRMQSRS